LKNVDKIKKRLLNKKRIWYRKNFDFNTYIAEFEHLFEEEISNKEKKKNNIVIKADPTKTLDLSKNELDSMINVRIKKEENEKINYAIKKKNSLDKNIRQLYGSIFIAILTIIYFYLSEIFLFNKGVYKYLFWPMYLIEVVAIAYYIRSINSIKNIKHNLCKYFNNDVFLKKFSHTYLVILDNDYMDYINKVNAFKTVINKDIYIIYRIKKLYKEKKGELGIAIFILLLGFSFWTVLLFTLMNYIYKFIRFIKYEISECTMKSFPLRKVL